MSRLDSHIRRVTAQRDILNSIASDVTGMEGPIIELGLGNGRTYDHLRGLFAERRIVAFDRALNAFRGSIPDAEDLVIGEIRDTAARFAGVEAALVHSDIATGYSEIDDVTATWLPDITVPLLRIGGFAVSGIPLDHERLRRLPVPPGVATDRYFLYRRL
jgi:hypothetical protein